MRKFKINEKKINGLHMFLLNELYDLIQLVRKFMSEALDQESHFIPWWCIITEIKHQIHLSTIIFKGNIPETDSIHTAFHREMKLALTKYHYSKWQYLIKCRIAIIKFLLSLLSGLHKLEFLWLAVHWLSLFIKSSLSERKRYLRGGPFTISPTLKPHSLMQSCSINTSWILN